MKLNSFFSRLTLGTCLRAASCSSEQEKIQLLFEAYSAKKYENATLGEVKDFLTKVENSSTSNKAKTLPYFFLNGYFWRAVDLRKLSFAKLCEVDAILQKDILEVAKIPSLLALLFVPYRLGKAQLSQAEKEKMLLQLDMRCALGAYLFFCSSLSKIFINAISRSLRALEKLPVKNLKVAA